MKKAFIIFLLGLFFFNAQSQQTSSTFDQDYAAKFQNALDSVSLAKSIRGVSMALIIPGQGTFIGVSGESYSGVPVTPDMRFGIGSNTKLFTATTLLKLQEEGVLSLEDHLYDWLPSYSYIDSSATIRQLLQHQTGFYDYFNDNPLLIDSCFIDSDRVWTPDEILATIGAPHFAVGEKYSYSNTNYLLAGMIIEAATGENYLNKYHQFILDPLEMDSTFVPPSELPNGDVAHEFYGSFDMGDIPQPAFYSIASSAGNIFSTANEMATWYKNLFDDNIVSDSSLQQIINLEHSGSFYGLGITCLAYNGHILYYHGGGTVGYITLMMYDVDTKSTLCILTNDNMTDFGSYLVPILNLLYNQRPQKSNDVEITSINNPVGNSCYTNVTPMVTLKNSGSNELTSLEIDYSFDGGIPVIYNWSGNLITGNSITLTLQSLSFNAGDHKFKVLTKNPNGAEDEYSFNDEKEISFIINDSNSPLNNLNEGFENYIFPPKGWYCGDEPVLNWGRSVLSPNSGKATAVMNNYNGAYWGGTKYDLYLPEINLNQISDANLTFEYAYKYRGSYKDSLRIMLSTDCGQTWTTIYYNGGTTLASGSYSVNFYPASSDWKSVSIDLSSFSGNALIRFRDISYGGNNLFIDEVKVGTLTTVQTIQSTEVLTISPNPFSVSSVITLNNEVKNGELKICDLTGRKLFHIQNIQGNQITLNRLGLNNGMYLFYIEEDNHVIGKGKFIVN